MLYCIKMHILRWRMLTEEFLCWQPVRTIIAHIQCYIYSELIQRTAQSPPILKEMRFVEICNINRNHTLRVFGRFSAQKNFRDRTVQKLFARFCLRNAVLHSSCFLSVCPRRKISETTGPFRTPGKPLIPAAIGNFRLICPPAPYAPG